MYSNAQSFNITIILKIQYNLRCAFANVGDNYKGPLHVLHIQLCQAGREHVRYLLVMNACSISTDWVLL
jgi:hypothetical protein